LWCTVLRVLKSKMRTVLVILFITLLGIGAADSNDNCGINNLQCDDTTLEEENAHSASCEILFDALYDLEVSGSSTGQDQNNPEDKRTSALRTRKHREEVVARSKGNHIVKRSVTVQKQIKRQVSTSLNASAVNTSYNVNPPFMPTPNMTAGENRMRLQVCKAMLQLPGVRRRCCTTLWITCPEFGPDAPPVAVNKPDPPANVGGGVGGDGGSILESSSQAGQSVLSGIANNLMNSLSNFLNGKVMEPVKGWVGDVQRQG